VAVAMVVVGSLSSIEQPKPALWKQLGSETIGVRAFDIPTNTEKRRTLLSVGIAASGG
jgi:hypothetical protein